MRRGSGEMPREALWRDHFGFAASGRGRQPGARTNPGERTESHHAGDRPFDGGGDRRGGTPRDTGSLEEAGSQGGTDERPAAGGYASKSGGTQWKMNPY